LDRNSDILELVDTVTGYWNYDLYSRKPSPALYSDDGTELVKKTNLDLATFLYALWDRGACINLPKYKGWRPRSITEGQILTSNKNRHGKITGLVSNKDLFSFNVRIDDANVMTTDGVGASRNFSLTGPSGEWFDGWKKIEFLATAKENEWLTEAKVWDNHTITFEHFVNPNRWISFFGQYYFISKCMIERLKDEKKHLTAVKNRILDSGVALPESMKETFPDYAKSTREEGKSVKIECLEVKVDVPESTGEYRDYSNTQESLTEVYKRLRAIRLGQEKLSFSVRTVEYAMYSQDRFDSFPFWFENVKWEDGFKEGPRSRTEWRRLKLVQPGVGERSVSIRYRIKEKSEIVAKDVVVREPAKV
jgi:hypothetical protein